MAYVPPHKRVSKNNNDCEGSSKSPIPKPELPPFVTNYKYPKHKSSAAAGTTASTTAHYQDMGAYAYEDIHRWFAAGLDDHNLFPPSVDLQPVSVESINGDIVQRLALFNKIDSAEELTKSFTRRPWEYIAENVLKDLHPWFEEFKRKMEASDQNHEKMTPTIITRIGKVLFRSTFGVTVLHFLVLRLRLRPRCTSSSYMAGKRKRKGANEPVKKDVSPEPNDNAVAWRNFFNANYKALRAVEKGLTEKEVTDKLKVQYKGFKSEWRNYDPNPTPAKKVVQTSGRKPKAVDGKGKKVEVDEEEVAVESEEASVYGRCSFNRLIRICKNLNLEQKDVIQNAGFGSFIREDAPYIDTRLVSWLIKHVDPTTSILDLYGRKIHLFAAMFGDVMGVEDGGDPVVTEGDSDTRYLEEILNVVDYTLSLTGLEKSLLECVEADSLFLIKFSLVVIGTVLAPKTGCDITSGYLHSLRVTRDIRHKNWATAGFRYLMNSIFRFQNKHTKNVSGCTLFLQLVYLTHVEWNFGYVDRTLLPVDFWGSILLEIILPGS